METFYGLSITQSLCSKHIACWKKKKKKAGGGGWYRGSQLKKQEEAETRKFIEDLHLVFNGFFHWIFPSFFFKLAKILGPRGETHGEKQKTPTKPNQTKHKAVQLSVTCMRARIWSSWRSLWMNSGLVSITLHLELLPALFSDFWSFWPDGDCFVLCCHIRQNEGYLPQPPPEKEHSWQRGVMLKEPPATPSGKESKCVYRPVYCVHWGCGQEAGGDKSRPSRCWDRGRV